MAQDDKQLPEGTDKVIAGASAGGGRGRGGRAGAATGDAGGRGEETIAADTTLVSEKPVAAPRGDAERARSGGGSPEGGEGRGRVMDQIRSGRDKISGQAADKARDFVGQGIERSSEALTNVAKLVSDTADGIDERLGPEYGDYARRAGTAIDDAARKLAAKDPDELIDDTRAFVRKSPGVALAGAAIVGFAIARLIRTGLDSGRSGREPGDEER